MNTDTILARIEACATHESVQAESKAIRNEIHVALLSRGKLREYEIEERVAGGEPGEVKRTPVSGTPFGGSLAVRKRPEDAHHVVDHCPTGLRLASFRAQKLARLVAAEVDRHAGPEFNSTDGRKAVASLPEGLSQWLRERMNSNTFEPFTPQVQALAS